MLTLLACALLPATAARGQTPPPEDGTTPPTSVPAPAAATGDGGSPAADTEPSPGTRPAPAAEVLLPLPPTMDDPHPGPEAEPDARPAGGAYRLPGRDQRRGAVRLQGIEDAPGTPEAAVQPPSEKEGGTVKRPDPATTRARKPKVPIDPTDPCDRPNIYEIPLVDRTRNLLEEQTCGAALWLDGLFADKADVEAARRTHGFLEIANTWSQFNGYRNNTRLHVEVDLPAMKNRLSAFVGRENDQDFVRGRSEASELRSTFPQIDGQNEWLAGLGYSLPDTRNLMTSVRVGVRGLGPPRAFLQGRLRYTLYADDNDVAYVRTTPFWNTRDGFGVTQNFDYSHVLSRHYLARWYTVGTISERTVGVNWRNSAILYHNLEHKRGLAYEAFIRGETDEAVGLYEYGGRVLFRHPVLRQRLFLEWAAGYSWPRNDPEEERKGSANVGLSLELPFGETED